LGVTYTPYNGDGTCKSEGQVVADFGKLNGFGFVRSYGVDCNQIQHLIKAAKVHNKKLFLGVFDIDQLNNDLQTLIKGVGGSWDRVTAIAIGNELVNSGKRPAGAVVNAINTARGVLRGAGYQGPVVTVDTFVAIIANPQLCHASDFCAANCHAFFDGNVSPSGAGDFVKSQAERVSAAVGGKRTIITESGWPHQGSTNGKATPSDQNQQQAIASLKAKFAGTDGGIYLFSAFDDAWKKDNQYTFGTERYWGVM
jgi:exo-beta-1,3-glucanase (GH17 family)